MLTIIVGIANPGFFSPAGMIILIADIVPLLIMALGMTFAIYIGGIDLSVQQIANMITVITTVYLAQFGIWVVFIVIGVGALFGTLSGYVTTRFTYRPLFRLLPSDLLPCRLPNGSQVNVRSTWTPRFVIIVLDGFLARPGVFHMN